MIDTVVFVIVGIDVVIGLLIEIPVDGDVTDGILRTGDELSIFFSVFMFSLLLFEEKKEKNLISHTWWFIEVIKINWDKKRIFLKKKLELKSTLEKII